MRKALSIAAGLALLSASPALVSAQAPAHPVARRQDVRQDRRELRQDRHEVRSDRRDAGR